MEAASQLRTAGPSEVFRQVARPFRVAPFLILSCSIIATASGWAVAFVFDSDAREWVDVLRQLALLTAAIGACRAFFDAIVARIVGDLCAGPRAPAREHVREIVSHAAAICWTGALVSMIAWAGLLAVVLPGVLILMRWVYVVPVMAIERRYGRSAMRRSSELSRASSGRALMLVVMSLGLLGIGWIDAPLGDWGTWVASIFVYGVGAAIVTTLTTVIYLDLRARNEGLDNDMLAEQLAGTVDRSVER